MTKTDFQRFHAAMRGAWLAVSNGKEQPTDALLDVFWKTFSNVSIEDFERAIQAHLLDPKHGMFAPKPADIVRWLKADMEDDGRPDADEAWSIAMQAISEDATIVWTTEIRSAWAAAFPIIENANDKIGARKAFLATYERLVERAREQGEPVKWDVSLGHDPQSREMAVQQAMQLNRLGSGEALAMIEMVKPLALPSPEAGGVDIMQRITECRAKFAMDRAERAAKEAEEAAERMEQGKRAVNGLVEASKILEAMK